MNTNALAQMMSMQSPVIRLTAIEAQAIFEALGEVPSKYNIEAVRVLLRQRVQEAEQRVAAEAEAERQASEAEEASAPRAPKLVEKQPNGAA